MFQGPNWFAGKSRDRSAPFGPFLVPKEFFPNHANVRIVTKVNGVVKQDGNTKDLIWDEAHLIRYLSSMLTLYPGETTNVVLENDSITEEQIRSMLPPGMWLDTTPV